MKLFKSRLPEPDDEDDAHNAIEGERALTSVNRGLSRQNRIVNWSLMLGISALALYLLGRYYAGVFAQHREQQTVPKDLTHSISVSLPPLVKPSVFDTTVASADAAAHVSPDPAPNPADRMPPLPVANAAAPGQPAPKTLRESVAERRLKPQLRFSLDGVGGSGAAAVEPAPVIAGTPAEARPQAAQATHGGTTRASRLADPTLMMTRGKVIPCTVVPAIDTTLPGSVTCITAEDATGADNQVTLMERGTLCVGLQGGGISQGQRRVGIIWQRCETPQHVLVALDSAATDALGRPGIPGEVDNHFWDRFGAALALSLVSDIGPYLAAARQGGNGSTAIAFPTLASGPQDVVGEVLKKTIDIAPTLSAPQGARVLIYLAGDIDFRDVYQLERSK